jgi:DNA invertase Pin-like site-specific DNA recombinase
MACISKSELVKLQKTAKTDEAIGKKFGISRQAVHQLRVKYGIKANTAKNAERNDKISRLYKSGKTGIVIAKILGMSVSQVYRIIRR